MRFFYIFLLLASFLHGQDKTIDSLKNVLAEYNKKNSPAQDTLRVNVLGQLIELTGDDEWPAYNEELFSLLQKSFKAGNIRQNYYTLQMASVVANRGFFAQQHGNISKAIEFYHQSLEMSEKVNDKYGEATMLNNLGVIFQGQEDMDKALEYYMKSLKLREQINDKVSISYLLSNIGVIYDKKKMPAKSLEYYFKSLELTDEKEQPVIASTTMSNIGYNYERYGDPDCKGSKEECLARGRKKAMELYLKSLNLIESTGAMDKLAHTQLLLASLYYDLQQPEKALSYAQKSYQVSVEIGFVENIRNAARLLFQILKSKKKYKEALDIFKVYVSMQDSLNNKTNRNLNLKKEMQHEYDKRAAKAFVKAEAERKLFQTELNRKQRLRYYLYAGVFMILLFSGFMVNRFRTISKQKKLIEEQKKIVEDQKEIVEIKQTEILDSIRYAKRIQQALMPGEQYIDRNLKNLNKR